MDVSAGYQNGRATLGKFPRETQQKQHCCTQRSQDYGLRDGANQK